MTSPGRHSERCRDCKLSVRQFLEALYGQCVPNHRVAWSTSPGSYAGTPIQPQLERIREALEGHRGFRLEDFVKASLLAPCDLWIPEPGFVVEFDESQHFTAPRRSALLAYSDDLPLGFSPARWIALCERHHATDNDPPYRDEQRAWYDTLRDLVPTMHGLALTVRLYASELAWCTLDPVRAADRRRFADVALRHTESRQAP